MSTREAVLAALRAVAPEPVSGERIAEKAGVSRMAVAKQVAALRSMGYEISSDVGVGYAFLSAPPLAVPWEVGPLLTSPFWRSVEGGMSEASTNDAAKLLARQGAEEGTVVVAAEQTGGKGRLGRGWQSPPGGAYFSAVLCPTSVSVVDVPSLALAVGVGAARGLETLGARVSLKWPNDLLVDGAKLGGILVEAAAEAECVQWAVVGVGINVIRGAGALPAAAFVADQVDVTPAQVAAAVLDGIAETYEMWSERGFLALRDDYAQRDALAGKDVSVRAGDGTLMAAGRATEVDETGRLVVRTEQGDIRVVGGDVTLKV